MAENIFSVGVILGQLKQPTRSASTSPLIRTCSTMKLSSYVTMEVHTGQSVERG